MAGQNLGTVVPSGSFRQDEMRYTPCLAQRAATAAANVGGGAG